MTATEPVYEICLHVVFFLSSCSCSSLLLIQLSEVFNAWRGPSGSILSVLIGGMCMCGNCWLSSVWATKWTVISFFHVLEKQQSENYS